MSLKLLPLYLKFAMSYFYATASSVDPLDLAFAKEGKLIPFKPALQFNASLFLELNLEIPLVTFYL